MPEETTEYCEPDVVWWTKGGSVWHANRECSSISDSNEVFSGSIKDAEAAEKERGCKRCAK
ncbi:MAG: hypothetical protein U0M06_13005 [Clostridia bacterium]|nr:hypothetical protein [Clostridia bacterium]